MVGLLDLWLAILLAAVIVFVASSIIHMATPMHKGDYGKLPGEERILEVMREQGVARGEYMLPGMSCMSEMGTPEAIEKFKRGPVGFLTLRAPGVPQIGTGLIQWFLFSVLVSVLVAYTATIALPRGAAYMDVFRVTSTAAFLGYALSDVPNSIWKGVRWSITLRFVIDGVIYGLLTAGVFGWLWPAVG